MAPIFLGKGENLIGDEASRSDLADIPVGQGHLVYVGWDLSRYLPEGRKPSSVEKEAAYEEHYRIYENMVRDFLG